MLEKYFVSFQALGDNLISLSLLAQRDKPIKILGTKQTQSIITLIGVEDKFDLLMPFEDIPAFYDIRRQGIFKAIKDIIIFRSYVKKYHIQELVFEKLDWRARLLTFGISRFIAKNTTKQVYINRKNLLNFCYEENFKLKNVPKLRSTVQKVLINPLAREQKRNISKEHLESILEVLKSCNIKITLLDYSEDYHEFKNMVNEYWSHTSLNEVKLIMQNHDFFIGTDSFLIHLAYYLEKPFFIIFNFEYFDFLPPNCEVINNYIITSNCRYFKEDIIFQFKEIGLIV